MNQVVSSPEASDVFSMTLSRVNGGAFCVRSVEITGTVMRHRITFPRDDTIHGVFREELSDSINRLLEHLPMSAHVFSDPEMVIELPNLTLARLRALIHVAEDGACQVILRFRYFIGALQNAFRSDTHFTTPTLEHREQIAIHTLADIATPIFSLALNGSDVQHDPRSRELVARKLEDLSRQASELNFYLSLLTRYVTDCSPKRMESRAAAAPIARIA